jgi:hypothetical protein
MPKPSPCSCGDPKPHIVASEKTFDGYGLDLWSDGTITGRMGFYINGACRLPMPVARRVMADAGLFDYAEIGDLARRLRKGKPAGGVLTSISRS